MILYENTIEQFNDDVMQNCIADRTAERYRAHYNSDPGESQYRAWTNSLAILNNSFLYAGLKDNHVIVEYELPYSSGRIDVLLFGASTAGQENVVMLELKQWSNDHVFDCEADGNVMVDYGRFKKEQAHPSLQVQGYHFELHDFLEFFHNEHSPELSSCVYTHNYSKNRNPVLLSEKFSEATKTFPVFAKEDAVELSRYLKDRLAKGGGKILFERFAGSLIRPSKRLLDHTSDMINKQQIFNLQDDQIAAYNNIMHKAKQLVKRDKKSVVIVKGGPGTGKSVIALEVMGELLRQGKTVFHTTGGSAFTNTLRKVVGPRARNLFKFFFNFSKHDLNTVDVLVCDEAHRIRQNSNDYGVPFQFKSKNPQIDDLIRPAKLSIFFIDERQVVRPKEIGSVAIIKESAKGLGVSDTDIAEFELKTQFRCSGSDAYLQWLEKVLGMTDSNLAHFDKKMEFKIFDSPQEMREQIRLRNAENKNSARITAGFCWPWSNPNPDGSLVNDVKIGNFEMPWEKKNEFWKWATDHSGMEQVGTVYTAQGFEFDYIAVIFGNDLVYDPTSKSWKAVPENSYDTALTRNNKLLTDHLKNVYRVLLSRAHKGVYVYFIDKETEKYFKSARTV